MMKRIKVLIVDDSPTIRSMLKRWLSNDSRIELLGAATDPIMARAMIKQFNPDVITLDVEMPKMDGISFLEKIMKLRPMPVVMFSTLTQKNSETGLQAMEIGAIDYVGKPEDAMKMEHVKDELLEKIVIASKAKCQSFKKEDNKVLHPFNTPTVPMVVAIGASTGGVEALRFLMQNFPATMPPVIITQHMPEHFIQSFADRLDALSPLKVQLATEGKVLRNGHAYIASTEGHLTLKTGKDNWSIVLDRQGKVSGHKPSVDVMFNSVAANVKKHAVGLLCTGMGQDGANGMLAMRRAGAYTLAQNEASCVVYGMPKAAVALGAVVKECSLRVIPQELLQSITTHAKNIRIK